ncbi:hypothetical protein B0H65DRAFT_470964 [Neurospora tetraspora]|uniref:2EXR domain-containing protein n=1 Tax=Neurospora tetraspora TaxID=94610 RepID=A0AAE0JDU7_9PEZI|nr:hypothetical protein B0H65DRAFT_470964 [Neurospora tetraspora]
MAPTTTFHPFPLLPLELRLQIWESTITPRTVSLRVGTHWRPFTATPAYYYSLLSSTPTCAPPPALLALLHTCRESREVGLKASYQRAFSEWDTDRGGDVPHLEVPPRAPRYLWVNFDLDMIDIGGLGIQFVERYKRQIRRLKMERNRTSTVGRHEFRALRGELQRGEWEKLREVEIVVRDDAWFPESWRGDGMFVEGWKLDVRNRENGTGYTLLMEKMGGDNALCG